MHAKCNEKSYIAQKSLTVWEKFITTKESLSIQKKAVSCLTIFNKAHAEGATIWKTTRGRRKLSTAFKSRVNVNKDNHSNTLRDIK